MIRFRESVLAPRTVLRQHVANIYCSVDGRAPAVVDQAFQPDSWLGEAGKPDLRIDAVRSGKCRSGVRRHSLQRLYLLTPDLSPRAQGALDSLHARRLADR